MIPVEEHRMKRWKNDEKLPGGGLIYVTSKYDDAFSTGLLHEINILYENGWDIEDLMERFKRPYMEILYALLYLADEEKITRAFAYRRKTNDE